MHKVGDGMDKWLEALRDSAPKPVLELPPLIRLAADIGVPARYRECSIESWRGELPDRISEWNGATNLVLYGDTGTGKTHLATAVLLAAVRERYRAAQPGQVPRQFGVWRSSQAFIEDSKDAIDHGHDPTELYRYAPILMLDDVGSEMISRESGWRQERIAMLIGERYDRNIPTIVTTNLTPKQMGDLDMRSTSRLLSGVTIRLDGRDHRFPE